MTELACRCGNVRLEVDADPILTAECCCNSCREAADRISALPGAPRVTDAKGATHFVLYRKDRVTLTSGAQALRAFRLTPDAKTRRLVATCCNTPLFLEFKGGHWASLYAGLWPAGTAPAPQMRTMARDLPDRSVLPHDIPTAATQSPRFMWLLVKSWAAMGFRSPQLAAEAPPLQA